MQRQGFECAIGACATPKVIAPDEAQPVQLALDPVYLHWANSFPSTTCGARGGALVRYPRSGGSPAVLKQPASTTSTIAVVRSGTQMAWAERFGADVTIKACTTEPCSAVSAIWNGQDAPVRVVAEGASLFWGTTGGSIMKSSFVVGSAATWAKSQAGLVDVPVDELWVYWAAFDTTTAKGSIRRCRRGTSCESDGGELVAAPPSPRALTVSADAIWYVSLVTLGKNQDMALYRLAKKKT